MKKDYVLLHASFFMIKFQDIGTIPYREALAMQERLRAQRIEGKIGDRLLLLEHPPVFTLGKRECDEDIISSPDAITGDGIEVVKTTRGGRVTYHGPGQLVGYFICALERLSVKEFVWMVEEVCRLTLADFEISGTRDAVHPGIWIGQKKIAAVGLNFSRGVSMHGFALNVSPDLNHYRHIVACGIKGRGTTAMSQITAKKIEMGRVKKTVVNCASRVFSDHKASIASTSSLLKHA